MAVVAVALVEVERGVEALVEGVGEAEAKETEEAAVAMEGLAEVTMEMGRLAEAGGGEGETRAVVVGLAEKVTGAKAVVVMAVTATAAAKRGREEKEEEVALEAKAASEAVAHTAPSRLQRASCARQCMCRSPST